jgi:hypothetical protein
MSPQLGHAAFRVAFFITFVSLVLLFFERRGSPEFGVTVMTLVVGLLFIGMVTVFVRFLSR